MQVFQYVNGKQQFPSIPVKVLRMSDDVQMPEYATDGAAGFDLRAFFAEVSSVVIPAGSTTLIPTGLKMAIPYGYELQVRSRSGLSLKQSVVVMNSPGTVDSDYRGEIGVILHNAGNAPFEVRRGDRIAQAVVCPVYQASFQEVQSLDETARGQGGFGSTGVK